MHLNLSKGRVIYCQLGGLGGYGGGGHFEKEALGGGGGPKHNKSPYWGGQN